ncbi:MAG TPA: TIR domain-containing protein [Pseudonocardiaceae bacterium]|nr:TIR domain-containing protein [Pseudonocardiaceae bacterium]
MSEVFVNYRTGDEGTCATMIERELSRRFGSDHIFLASKSIKPGADYPQELLAAVGASSVLLAVIGVSWLSFTDEHGHNALDRDDDWIRKEILAAFDADIPVVPILVGRAERLRRVDLPNRLARLADCQYLRLDIRNAERDLRQIGDKLVDVVPGLVDADAAGEPKPVAAQGNVTGNVQHNTHFGSGRQFNTVGNVGHVGNSYGGEPKPEADGR